MILHTTPSFLIRTTTPHRPTSQHLRPLPYRTKLCRHHLAASSASLSVSAFLSHNSFPTTRNVLLLFPSIFVFPSAVTPSLLDYMLPSKVSRHLQIHSEYTPKYTSEYVLKYTPEHAFQDPPNCTRWYTWHSQSAWLYASNSALKMLSSTLPIALDGTFPAYLALRFQVHSQQKRHSQSHLTRWYHVCSCMLHPETCWVADVRHRES
jgi:hypothetical protein